MLNLLLEFFVYLGLATAFVGLCVLLMLAGVVVLCVIAHYFPKTRPIIKKILNS